MIQFATVAFGGAALAQALGGFGCQSPLLGCGMPLRNGFSGFIKEQSRHGGRATHTTDRANDDGFRHRTAAQFQRITRFDLT